MQAVVNSHVASQISGVITLATPFLFVRPSRSAWLTTNAASFLCVPTAVYYLINVFLGSTSCFACITDEAVLLAFSTSLGAGTLHYYLVRRYAKSALSWESGSPQIEPHRTLILRAISDEASGIINWAQYTGFLGSGILAQVAAIPTQLRQALRGRAHKIDNLRWTVPVLAVGLTVIGIMNAQAWARALPSMLLWLSCEQRSWLALAIIFASSFLGMVPLAMLKRDGPVETAMSIIAAPIVAPIVAVCTCLQAMASIELALLIGRIDVTAESTPVGTWPLRLLPGKTSTVDSRSLSDSSVVEPLAHSYLQTGVVPVGIMAQWIYDRFCIPTNGQKQ